MKHKQKSCKLPETWRMICYIICIFLLMIVGICAGILVEDFQGKHSDQMAFEELADTLCTEKDPSSLDAVGAIDPDSDVLAAYQKLAEENPDMIGWIQIEGTTVNYPVMYTPDQPSFYLKKNFYKEYSDLGTPFLQETCDPDESNNLILYGHHMIAGGMFSDLDLYKNMDFWKEHRIVRFDQLTEISEYEVFAAFVVDVSEDSWFRFHDFVDGSLEEYDEYVKQCKALSLYETGITPVYGEQLLTLVTCEYSQNNGRIVVVARKIEGGTK